MKKLKQYKEIEVPTYNEITAECACGATFQIGSVLKELRVDICSNCHPFYTGTKRIVDVQGRVDRFNKKYQLNK